MKVLVAEDDAVCCRVLEGLLTQWGYDVTTVHDGEAALGALQQEGAPKLAILERVMPGTDCLEVCREVRRRSVHPYPYIIILSARGDKEDFIEALNAGADGYLIRSLDAHHLRAYLNAAQRILDLQDELISTQEALREQATHDSLTRLWNHGAIIEILRRELGRSQRTREPVGIIMADLDHFKAVNDSRGHRAGDQVLCQVSRRLEAGLRPYDSIGRYGGEEFLIVLPGCDTACALHLAERLRKLISGKAVVVPEGPIPVTISLGAGSNREPHLADAETLLRATDTALYRAKNTGRNRVERASAAEIQGRRSG